ncbi:protein screw [Ceratitis capitata]|uniref:protein screw n=1 Tax=Ceratitis capitata TaxID=7213 RepID=UPI000618963A|nr:protein screw [Ceratitis capitata]
MYVYVCAHLSSPFSNFRCLLPAIKNSTCGNPQLCFAIFTRKTAFSIERTVHCEGFMRAKIQNSKKKKKKKDMSQRNFFLLILIFASYLALTLPQERNPPDEMAQLADLLGLGPASVRLKRQPSLSNSAAKFLLEVYKQISDEDEENLPQVVQQVHKTRYRRALADESFITPFDRREIELSNNIITFASRGTTLKTSSALLGDMLLNFNLNDIPIDLELAHAAIRLFQDPQLGEYAMASTRNYTIYAYQPVGDYLLLVGAENATTSFKGWLELNVTNLFNQWLRLRTLKQIIYGNDLLIGVIMQTTTASGGIKLHQVAASDVGLVSVHTHPTLLELQPFIIGYFNGPDLMSKMQRRARQQKRRQRHADSFRNLPPSLQHTVNREAMEEPKACERRNFTLDFKYLGMEKSVIAPKAFEAFYCLGECNFPLGTPMNNATNHAIVQTLMHLKRTNLPKPCCVPIKLASISILYSVNEDSVNLMRFSQIVAKECGCR